MTSAPNLTSSLTAPRIRHPRTNAMCPEMFGFQPLSSLDQQRQCPHLLSYECEVQWLLERVLQPRGTTFSCHVLIEDRALRNYLAE